jgi:hypothetical protein
MQSQLMAPTMSKIKDITFKAFIMILSIGKLGHPIAKCAIALPMFHIKLIRLLA